MPYFHIRIRKKLSIMAKESKFRDAKVMDDVVNNTLFNPVKTAWWWARNHRYLQQQFFKMCFHYILLLAKAYKEGRYDDRNEWACRTANQLMQGYTTDIDHEYSLYEDQYKECSKEYELER